MKKKSLQLIIMLSKNLLYGIIVQSLLFSLAIAAESNAQQALSVKEVNLNLKVGVLSIKEIFQEIETQTDFKFFFDKRYIDNNLKIQIDNRSHTVADVLLKISKEGNLKFKQINKTINISKLPKLEENSEGSLEIIIQTRKVTGKVTSFDDGEPLPGVNVIEKGTSKGTVTNVEGFYTLEVSEGATLVFSSVGYTREEVAIGNRSVVDFVMTPDIQQLQELVVIGYGAVKKSDLTGSVSSISTEELANVPISSVEQMMQGRAAGVQITSSSGGPGASSSIKIRGVNSINSSSEPLYVIDGVPIAANSTGDINANGTSSNTGFSILSTINPGDIESIEVLKDASSTAIYGSRGANGVIIITTKSGKQGKSTIDFNANYGVSVLPNHYEVLGANDFVTKFNEFAAIEGISPIPSDGSIELADNNWMDLITRNGATQNYQLSISGGDNKTQYFISGSFFDQQGIIKESFLKRYSGRINIEHKPVDRVKVGANFSYTNSSHALTNPDRLIRNAVGFAPVIPQTDPEGAIFYPSFEYLGNGQIYSFNPLGDIYGELRDNFNDRILLNSFLNLDITEDLSFKTTIGLDLINATDQSYMTKLSARGVNTKGSASVEQQRTNSLININQLTYTKTFNTNHNVTGTLIHEVTKATTQTFFNGWNNFTTDALGFYGIGTGGLKQGVANNFREWTMMSFAGRLNYNYASKYLATFTARRDGSSRFGKGNKWGFFPSGALAWKVSEEPFLNSLNSISNLKLRASFGITGNTDIGFYNSIVTIGTDAMYSSGTNQVAYYFPQRIANEDLKWETTKQINLGFDLGLFDNRINIIADYFNSVTDDLLLAVNIPENSGYSSVLKNAGSVENKGVELSLNAILVQNENFTWDISSTFSRSVNKVTNLGGEHHIGVGGQTLIVGQPLQNQMGYTQIGIFQSEEEILASPSRPNDEPGVPKYKDVNQDGKIDGNDMVTLGRGFPDFYYGLTNNFKYKNFDLFLYLTGINGITIYNETKFMLVADGGTNTLKEYFDNRWTENNPSQKYPRSRPQIAGRSSQFLEDASFIRLKALTLGYRLPLKVDWVNNARVYVTGQNLFTLTKYTGYDPEVNSAGQSNVAPPVDNSAYPRARTISVGVNFTF